MAVRGDHHTWTSEEETNLVNLRMAGRSFEQIGAILGVRATAAESKYRALGVKDRRSYDDDPTRWEKSCVVQNELFARAMINAGYKPHVVTSSDHNPQARYGFQPLAHVFSQSALANCED